MKEIHIELLKQENKKLIKQLFLTTEEKINLTKEKHELQQTIKNLKSSMLKLQNNKPKKTRRSPDVFNAPF